MPSYLAYFQPFSNTYADLDALARRYEEALSFPGVRGLVVGTRPDCIDPDKLQLLADIRSRGVIVEIEYGIESVYDQTLRRVNRGHDFACTRRAFEMTAQAGLEAGGHLILGLPGETREMMVASAQDKERPGDFLRPGPQDYISLLADILERLRPEIAIGRIVSSVPPRFTEAPWGLLRQDGLMRALIGCLNGRNSFQGRLYSPTTATP